ncbi:lytic transglycosylase domain-containing protein [Motilibacter aurantiacus]|uniref:lytic transglycosylase domain-containing protein n=1 Tax=Motilibacter aurantiacus TaxID=2714955 RepID=UPI00140BC4EE|nr:lytic murein transglycosylase [Motilibacter aurantiacus]NHC44177.1 hypothetical protein [Motilibacter aurantiacus]
MRLPRWTPDRGRVLGSTTVVTVALAGIGASAAPRPPAPAPAAAPASPVVAIAVPEDPAVSPLGAELRAGGLTGPTTPPAAAPEQATSARVVPSELTRSGIPVAALTAYRRAQILLGRWEPGCHLDWSLLAAIGRVESNHGRFGGSVLGTDGKASPAILGPRLDGVAFARILDSDGGRLDGDTEFDRAVGPMQFIPTTWAMVAADGDGDGVEDPHDLDDAAVAAGLYLCSGGRDVSALEGRQAAVFSYNRSDTYVYDVLMLSHAYATGLTAALPTPVVPDRPKPTPTVSASQPASPVQPPAAKPTPAGTPATAPSPKPTPKPTPTASPAPAAPTPTAKATPSRGATTTPGTPPQAAPAATPAPSA